MCYHTSYGSWIKFGCGVVLMMLHYLKYWLNYIEQRQKMLTLELYLWSTYHSFTRSHNAEKLFTAYFKVVTLFQRKWKLDTFLSHSTRCLQSIMTRILFILLDRFLFKIQFIRNKCSKCVCSCGIHFSA